MFEQSLYTVTILTILAYLVLRIEGHGRMMEPPSRMSAYLAGFPTPKNYEDHQMNCGGFSVQWEKNGGRCGICGDPWSGPRMYERPGGFYVKGPVVITQTYEENQSIKVSIQLTQNHKGWFEFRLCDIRTSGGVEADQACLDRHLLADDTGRTRFDSPSDNSGLFDFYLVLPPGLTCPQCLLQWKWKCGNNWGCDETGCGTGKGERQEEFYACADIKIEPRGGSLDNTQPLPPQPQPDPLQPQQPQQPPQPYPIQPQQPQQPPQPQPFPIQPQRPQQPVQPQPSQPISKGRLEIPEGFSSYSEYLQNMFATTTNNALVFANKIRVSTGGVKRSRLPARPSSNPAKEVYDRQFLREVVGYPSRWQQQSYSYRGLYLQPVGLPSWLSNRQHLADQDSVDRLCAACHNGCRFSACGWHCSRQCLI